MLGQWLKGPELVRWCEETGIRPVTESQKHRFKDWAKGGAASIYAVDRLLTYLDRALGEIPEELYISTGPTGKVLRADDRRLAPVPPPPTREITDENKATICAAFKAGVPSHVIAEHFKIDYYKIVRLKGEWNHGRYSHSNRSRSADDAVLDQG